MNEDLKWMILTVIPSIAAIFAILTYRRNRRLDNENHLYRIKIEAYSRILSEITVLLNRLQDYVKHFKNNFGDPNLPIEREYEISSMATEVDNLIFSFDESVTKNSLVVSKDIVSKLSQFSLKLFSEQVPDFNIKTTDNTIEILDDFIADIILAANEINESMRKDLSIDELNLSLYRRIKSTK